MLCLASAMAVARPAGPPPSTSTGFPRRLMLLRGFCSECSFVLNELARTLVENDKSQLRPERNHVQVGMQVPVSITTDNHPVPFLRLGTVLCCHIVRALGWPPKSSTIREIRLPGEGHLFGKEARRMGRINPEFPAEMWLRVIRVHARDVVGAFDSGKEWSADACLKRGLRQRPRLARHRNLFKWRGGWRRPGPIVVKVATDPVLDVRHLVLCQRKKCEGRFAGICICSAVELRHPRW